MRNRSIGWNARERHEHRVAANSDDPFRVTAEMQSGEIRVFTALTDDDKIGGGIELSDGVH
jgi:hypothetical protein